MNRTDIVILGKAIRDTLMAPTARGLLVTNIIRYMQYADPMFKEKILRDVVSNAEYKDRLIEYKIKDVP